MTVRELLPGEYREASLLSMRMAEETFGPSFSQSGRAAFAAHVSEGGFHARRARSVLLGVFEGVILCGLLELQTPGRVSLLAVERAFRGRGYARALVDRAATLCMQAGGAALTISCPETAKPALSRLGFACDGPPAPRFGMLFYRMHRSPGPTAVT